MKKLYKVNSHNSTACGYPGREFDWSKFCWDGSDIHLNRCGNPKHKSEEEKAPLPWKDDGLIGEGNEYLHVPYDWQSAGTIYRVRPNESMQAGKYYRSLKRGVIKKQRAIQVNGEWFWELTF